MAETEQLSTTFAVPDATIVCLVEDLFFGIRLDDVIRASGGQPVLVERADVFVDAVDRYFPVLGLVDLSAAGDCALAITRCKIRPHTGQIPIIAFGSHVDTATLRAARQAGADHVWARSKLMGELQHVVMRYLHPAVDHPEGWEAPLSNMARHGIEVFNQGEYFEQHELLEQAWLAEERPVREMYQGILQIGVAFLQIERNNWGGAVKMFRRGLPRLRTLPPVCQGVAIAPFRAAAEQIHWEITALGAERLHEFDHSRFPRIAMSKAALQGADDGEGDG